jgi:hypothetical protein
MKWCLTLVLAAIAVPAVRAIERPYQPGKIISVQQKEHTRILYYLVNTPVTQDDPYYEVSVQLRDTVYITEYTPRHQEDTLPEDWTADTDIQARLDKQHLFVKRPNGFEIDLVVVKRTAGPRKASEPTPPKK